MEFFKKTMGWEDGHCQNLSGFEGDYSTIKMILNEIQEEKERKKKVTKVTS